MSSVLLVEIASLYWFGVFLLLDLLVVLIALSSLDDFFIDLCYWARRLYRRVFILPHHPPLLRERLYERAEQPIAVMVPAWKEAGVISRMLVAAAENFDYDRYVIFVGTYCNDPETQADADAAVARRPNHIRKVVVPHPGPTSKADCLNSIVADIWAYEVEHGIRFAGMVLHDAEDVVHELELRLFNYLLPRKDFIQLPVFPLERDWTHLTSGHYLDEFAEQHAKDLVVREWLVGQVPSAGVGTCFSRRAIEALAAEGEVFNGRSLTEDYEISFRLKRLLDIREIFVRFPIASLQRRRGAFGLEKDVLWHEYVGVREYFPDCFSDAVRQKARWITGIVFQGTRNIRWRGSLALKYFLLRDRKGGVTNFLNVLGYFIVLNVLGMVAYRVLEPDGYAFPSLVQRDSLVWWLLIANAVFFCNRIFHRVYFVWEVYGPFEALMVPPRLIWGNVINFFAAERALRRVLSTMLKGGRLTWEKTTHTLPDFGGAKVEPQRAQPGAGAWFIDAADKVLAELAAHVGVPPGEVLSEQGLRNVVTRLTRDLAFYFRVCPLAVRDDGTLVLCLDGQPNRVMAGLLQVRLGRDVELVPAPDALVDEALNWIYDPQATARDTAIAQEAIRGGYASEEALAALSRRMARSAGLLDLLEARPDVDAAQLQSALEDYVRAGQEPLGRFLVERRVINEELLDEVLNQQAAQRRTFLDAALEHGVFSSEEAQELQRRAAA